MMMQAHLAIDLGASSGRAIVGALHESSGKPLQLRLQEVHRFEHHVHETPKGPIWDLAGIWRHLLTGLAAAAEWCRENHVELKSIGVDTWGVDWVLVDKQGELLGLPHCYRDPQNEVACQQVLAKVGGFEALYERTGIQMLPFNTLFQLQARYVAEPAMFAAADRLLFLPDLLHFWLSGEQATELSIASTSSMLNVDRGDWDRELLSSLGLPTEILGTIVEPGTPLGRLKSEIAQQTGAPADLQVIIPASHDTASAVAAVPAKADSDWAYLSSGTWSLLGAELTTPVSTAAAREVPFTNERGVGGTIRFLKNIAGLWLVQELQRDFQRQGHERTFEQLAAEARSAEAGRTVIDPDFPEFATAGDMSNKIQRYANDTGQAVPETMGQLVRCCLEGLARSYAKTLDQLRQVSGTNIDVLHLVGGGTQNELLNELTAQAVDCDVTVGPIEATAIGNTLVQAMACGRFANLPELREVVTHSFPLSNATDGQPVLN
jgi:rhamnulokinase